MSVMIASFINAKFIYKSATLKANSAHQEDRTPEIFPLSTPYIEYI